MKTELWPLERLIDYARNPRKNDHAVDRVAAAIKEFGFRVPIIAKSDGLVVDGHLRLKAARKLGLAEVPVVLADDLTDAQVKAFRISVNRMAELAEWDNELLALELGELGELGFDLDLTGFGEGEIAALTPGGTEGLTDPDEVPEPPVVPTTQPGDLWTLGDHRLLCGDSTKAEDVARLMAGAKADLMFTDPPYGVDYSGGIQFQKDGTVQKNNREKLKNDSTPQIYNDFLPVALSVVDGPCYMWFSDSKVRDVYNAVHDNGCEVHALIIWHKTNATYAAMNAQYKQRHEPCLYFKPRGSTLRWCGETTEATVWSQDRDGINEFHPTQKPIALAAKALKNHKAAIVLDMFCGSGSTLIAAEQLGRKCYGLEISPAYCDVIVQRWEQFTGKQATRESARVA